MDGHAHIGLSHFLPFGMELILALLLFRLLAILTVNSGIPLLKKAGTALAWIVG